MSRFPLALASGTLAGLGLYHFLNSRFLSDREKIVHLYEQEPFIRTPSVDSGHYKWVDHWNRGVTYISSKVVGNF
jgi:hypothetical protein